MPGSLALGVTGAVKYRMRVVVQLESARAYIRHSTRQVSPRLPTGATNIAWASFQKQDGTGSKPDLSAALDRLGEEIALSRLHLVVEEHVEGAVPLRIETHVHQGRIAIRA